MSTISRENLTPAAIIPISSANDPKKVLKPCCVCKETKSQRDECMVLNGEENCGYFIEAHKKCLREFGFEI